MLFDEFHDKLKELEKARLPGVRFNDGSEVCFYCGKKLKWGRRQWATDPATAVIEHVMPKALGGTNSNYNLVWACQGCNNSKGAKHPIVWLESSLLTIPDDILFDIRARILLHYQNDLLALAHLIRVKIFCFETLEGEEDR